MPVYELTSAKTGQNYRVDFDRDPVEADVDEAVNYFDNEFARQNGVAPEVLDQGPLGTVVNKVRNVGPAVVGGLMETGGNLLGAGARLVGLPDSLPQGIASIGADLQEEGRRLRPTNPANVTANTIGSGLQQGIGLVATMGAAAPVVGVKAALGTVPLVMGGIQGGGQGVMTARDMGIESPAGQLGMGAAFGAAEMLAERMGGAGSKALTEAVQRGVAGTLKRAGKTMGSEAVEEPVTGFAQDAATWLGGQAVEDPNRPGFTTTGYELPKLDAAMLERRKQEAIGGAAGGTVFAGLQLALPNNETLPTNQTPAQAGTTQAPGTTPATAAMAGGAGAVPSTLSRIAQESLVPDLPEFTGELTAEDVQDLEGVGQSMSDPSTLQVGGAASPMPGAFRVTGEGSTPSPATSPTASVTEESSVTADQTAQPTPGAGLSPAAGSFSPAERSPEAQAYAQAVAQAAEEARQAQIARLRMIDNKAQGMPLIPDSPRGDRDILDFANENPIYLPPGFSEERNLPEYEKLKEAKLPAYWRQFVASSKRGGNPEQVAQRAYDAGLISEPDAGLYLDAVREGIDSRKQYRVDFAAREKALETEEKQVIDFEKTQQTLRRKDKERVRFEDIAPGDEMTIDGEKAVVKNIEYTEDGYLTNVVIEDGKRFGLMQFDPQNRQGIFVDEFTPKQREQPGDAEEPLFSRAAPRLDFSGLMQNAQAVASGAQAPQTSAALGSMINAPGQRSGPVPAQAGPRGVNRFFPASSNQQPGSSILPAAYREATRGSSTQMAPLSSVYAQARLLQPGLTPEAFLAQVQDGYNNGTLYLEGAGSQQEAQQASLSLPGTPVGTAVRMMPSFAEATEGRPAPQAETPLRNAAAGASNAAMASNTGAAQNTEPSPGGLSEAEVKPFSGDLFRGENEGNGTNADKEPGGIHFTSDETYARQYGRIRKARVTLTNALDFRALGKEFTSKQLLDFLRRNGIDTKAQSQQWFSSKSVNDLLAGSRVIEAGEIHQEALDGIGHLIKQAGFDGYMFAELGDFQNPAVVVFSEESLSNPESSRAASGTSPSLPVSESPSLASPAELTANQKANEAILKSLGLPTAKGTRVWGAAKVKTALAKLSTDMRYPATTRLMARELSKLSLDNLLLKIEADARLNWAGLYQPFTDGRGELSLNTRIMGRGDLDIGISLVHEALHHATYRNLRSPRTARQKQAKADLEALFKRAKAALAVNGRLSQFDYELSNTDEFITGLFTRADFQAALADIPADAAPQSLGQRVRSVLDEIFRVLAELVTSKAVPPGSVLEASMAATLRLMEDGRSVQAQEAQALPTLQNPALNPFTPSDAPGWMRTLFKVPSVGAFRVQNLSVRKLLTGSALPTAMADIVTASDRDKQSIEYAAATLANDLEQAMQAHSQATGQTQQQVNDLVSNVLQGALPLTIVLNPELRTAIRRARNLLDSLSTAVAGATSGQMGSTILANLGSWMRRSYAAFDPAAGWSFDELTKAAAKGRKVAGEPAAKILADARRYLRSQTPGITNGELEAQMRQLMDRNLWEEALIGSGAGVRKDVSSLMKRKDIAPEIRALMGEERNPVKKLIGSAKWQAQFIAKHENQQKIRDVGLQLGMFSPSQTGRFTEELGEDRSTSGFALNGKKIYTTPELRAALGQTTGVLATDDLGSNFLKMIYWLGGQAKLNKVALNPDSWVVNLLGNVTGLAMTGGLSPFAPLRLYQNSRKAVELLRSGKKQAAAGTQQQVQNDLMRQMMAKLTAAGVADSSMNAQLVEDALNKNLIQFIERHDVWNGAVGAVKLAVIGQALAKPFGAAGRAVGGVVGGVAGYTIGNERVQNVQEAIAKWTMQNPDRFGKIVEFLDNQTTLMASGMTPDAAFAKATQKTLNTMPDYSKLPAVLRQFSRLGVVGSFIAFQWEVYRNSFHNAKYIVEELGSGNPALMEKGARRLLGMGAVYALALGGLQAILGNGDAGDDEKDEAYRRALGKPWEKYSRLAYTRLDTEKASFYNTSYLLPQVTLTEILRAAAEGKDFPQAMEQAGGVLQKQFAETGIHADPLLALLFNLDRGGQKATTEQGWRATVERLGEILAPMTPGAADKFERLLRSKEVLNAPRWDREFSVEEEMKRLLGIRQATYSHERRIAGRLSEFNQRKRDIATTAAQVYGEAGKDRADVWGRQAQQQAANRATERLTALKAEYDQFVKDLGTLGFKPTQIERFRKDAGTSPNWKPYGITPEGIKQP